MIIPFPSKSSFSGWGKSKNDVPGRKVRRMRFFLKWKELRMFILW